MSFTIKRRPLHDDPCRFASHLPKVLRQIYAARGVTCAKMLDLRLTNLLDYSALKNIQPATDLLAQAIIQNKPILLIGDIDADGATAITVGMLGLKSLGASCLDYLVPSRFEHSYGLSPELVTHALQHKRHPYLLVTVDHGITSLAGVEAAQKAGIKVIITDHHLPGAELPKAEAIVNPNQQNCPFASKNLAGCGVIFYVLCALRARLSTLCWFNPTRTKPNLASLLDIVAIGTVADIVNLDCNNRILVEQGLRRMRAGLCRPGIRALCKLDHKKLHSLQAQDLSFSLAPKLNAAGRLESIALSIELLLAQNATTAKALAQQLHDLNIRRRQIEKKIQDNALTQLKNIKTTFSACLFAEEWHPGVIGIVAARIKEHLNRPVIVFALENDANTIKGSARSIEGFNLAHALGLVHKSHPQLLLSFGGHAMAAGLTIRRADLKRFRLAFEQICQMSLTAKALQPVILTDGCLEESHFSISFAEELRNAGPWGRDFPEPLFDGYFDILSMRTLKQKHLKLLLRPQGCQVQVEAIAFHLQPTYWTEKDNSRIHAAFRLTINEFKNTKRLQLILEYLTPCI